MRSTLIVLACGAVAVAPARAGWLTVRDHSFRKSLTSNEVPPNSRVVPPEYRLAFVFIADIRRPPPRDDGPETAAQQLMTAAKPFVDTTVVLVTYRQPADSATACRTLRAVACDVVMVREFVPEYDDQQLAMKLDGRRGKGEAGEPHVFGENTAFVGCPNSRYAEGWRGCREDNVRAVMDALSEHLKQHVLTLRP